MDFSSKLFDMETGDCIATLKGHEGEVISLNFTTEGDRIITGSFDGTAKIWDVRTGLCIDSFEDHSLELSNALFEFADFNFFFGGMN